MRDRLPLPAITVLLDTNGDLTLDVVRRVAWDGEGLRLTDRALQALGRRRAEFLAFVDAHAGERLYGITTAHHTGATALLSPAARDAWARRLPTTPASFGPALPERVVRAILLARLTDPLAGTAPLAPETVLAVVALLDGPAPPVPERGAGEPGDIIALSHLLRERLEGDGRLGLGEGMALVNGSPVASAVLADAALAGTGRIASAEAVLALAAEAALAPAMHYDEALEELWCDEHQAVALRVLRTLLAGGHPERLGHQAPVSFRSAPRVLGWLRRAQAQAEEAAAISLRAPSNNPVFVGPRERPPLGAILSNGGYHDPLAAPAIDALARSWADLAQLAAHQVNRLVEDPEGLVAHEPEAQVSLLYMTSAGWAEEARAAIAPSLIGLAGGGQTDTGTPDLLAWRRARDAGAALEATLAVLAVVAAHTIARTGRRVPPALVPLHEIVLGHFPLGLAPAGYGAALAATARRLAAGPPILAG